MFSFTILCEDSSRKVLWNVLPRTLYAADPVGATTSVTYVPMSNFSTAVTNTLIVMCNTLKGFVLPLCAQSCLYSVHSLSLCNTMNRIFVCLSEQRKSWILGGDRDYCRCGLAPVYIFRTATSPKDNSLCTIRFLCKVPTFQQNSIILPINNKSNQLITTHLTQHSESIRTWVTLKNYLLKWLLKLDREGIPSSEARMPMRTRPHYQHLPRWRRKKIVKRWHLQMPCSISKHEYIPSEQVEEIQEWKGLW